MSSDLFQTVRDGLQPRLVDVLADILPGGRIVGREYCCASLEGGQGNSCRTNLQNGVGSDFATGERWSDIISLAAQCWRLRPGEAARELARRYALSPDCATTSSPAPARPFIPLLPVPPSAPEPPRRHGQLGMYTRLWRYLDEAGRLLACVARFSREDGSKVILPLSYGQEGGTGFPAGSGRPCRNRAPCMACMGSHFARKRRYCWWKEKKQRMPHSVFSRSMLF